MKIRKGFVSNSSSSSFICDLCGGIEADRDLCLDDAYMFTCAKCDSTFHEDCIEVPEDQQEEFANKLREERYEVEFDFCPVCNITTLSDSDELTYYRMINGCKQELTRLDIVKKFGDYEKFMNAVVEWKQNKETK